MLHTHGVRSPSVKLLFDLFPVIIFFAAYKFGGADPATTASWMKSLTGSTPALDQAPVMLAAAAGIVASIVQLAIVYLRGKKPEPMLWISLVIVVVFGSLTIYLHNAMFVKWKPTILYWIFAAILFYGTMAKKNFLENLMGKNIELPSDSWRKMQIGWELFFALAGVINLVIAYTCSTDFWVNFKLFGLTALTLIFTIGIGIWITKTAPKSQNDAQ